MTYNHAVNDEKLTGLERLEITQIAMAQKVAIAQKVIGLDRWWSFGLLPELIDEYKQLQPIGINHKN